MSVEEEILNVSEMAKKVYLSRSRFNKLIKDGYFPPPSRGEKTNRPFYDQAGQTLCLDVRRRRIGINGEPIFFHKKEKEKEEEEQKPKLPKQTIYHPQLKTIMKYLQGLGLKLLDKNKVNEMVKSRYPAEITETLMPEFVRTLFWELSESVKGQSYDFTIEPK